MLIRFLFSISCVSKRAKESFSEYQLTGEQGITYYSSEFEKIEYRHGESLTFKSNLQTDQLNLH